MANLEKKDLNPVLVAVANWFIAGILGYILIGQTSKAIKVFLAILILSAVTFFVGGIGGVVVWLLATIDGFQVATAVEAGEEVAENEYKNEILFKIVKLIDKDAVCKTVNA